jgi:hypothetical protein
VQELEHYLLLSPSRPKELLLDGTAVPAKGGAIDFLIEQDRLQFAVNMGRLPAHTSA